MGLRFNHEVRGTLIPRLTRVGSHALDSFILEDLVDG